MAATRIDGKALAAHRRAQLTERIAELSARGVTPCLTAVSASDDPAWRLYQNRQHKACAAAGLAYRREDLGEQADQAALLERVESLNADPEVHGIIIQAPLPAQFDLEAAQALIAPAKDVEGVTPANLGQVLAGRQSLAPCTARSAVLLAQHQLTDLRGIDAVVVGSSTIVGKPAAQLLLQAGATVTVCHIDTRDLSQHTRAADLVVIAVGKPNLLQPTMVKPGATVIDVGINQITKADGSRGIVGDVAESVWEVAGAVTPVPGGVGSLTTTILLEHTVDAAERQQDLQPALNSQLLSRILGSAGVTVEPTVAASLAHLVSRHLVAAPADEAAKKRAHSAFERRLTETVLVLDGGVGTELKKQGIAPHAVAEANLTMPDVVEAVHRSFVSAGAQAITTNTHGINRWSYELPTAQHLVRAGTRLAREASGGQALVFGSIGPLGRVVGVDIAESEAVDAVAEIAAVMADSGADAILCETLASTAEAVAHVRGVRQATALPVLVCRRYDRDDMRELTEFAHAMEREGAAAIGLNCVRGPRAMASGVARLASLTRLPVIARPNAGDPRRHGDHQVYELDPAWLVEQVRAYVASGVHIVGGCCGVGPEHIAALHAIADELLIGESTPEPLASGGGSQPVSAGPDSSGNDHSNHALRQAFADGRFVTISLLAARLDAEATQQAARALATAGVQAIGLDPAWPGSGAVSGLPARLRYVTDAAGVDGVFSLDPWAMDLVTAQEMFISAHLLGVRCVLVDTGVLAGGADGTAGCGPERMLHLLNNLNQGRDAAGSWLDVRTAFAVGVRLPIEEVGQLASWSELGAEFATVQPVYEPARFRQAMATVDSSIIPLLAEILVLPDAATADELDNEVPALSVPQRLRERLRADPSADVDGVVRFIDAWRTRLAGAVLLLPDAQTQAAVAVAQIITKPGQ